MKYSTLLYTATLALVPQFCLAQQLAFTSTPDKSTPAASSSVVKAAAVSAPEAKDMPLTERWLDISEMSHSERYRGAFNWFGYHNIGAGQERNLLTGKFKLDSDARYTINFRASSGRMFVWAYADFAGRSRSTRVREGATSGLSSIGKTPAELAESKAAKLADPAGYTTNAFATNGWEFYLRELYLSATPVKAATLEFGSFGFERGYGSEITTFDNDGYLTGERIRIQVPKHLFFDQVGFTSAYMGFLTNPSVFDRGAGFQSSNYRQVFVKKQLNERLGFSADYMWLSGLHSLHQAAQIDTKESKLVDAVRFESYERLNATTLQGLSIAGGSGFAVTAEKKITKRLQGDVGFASIDKDYTAYGGSRYLHSNGQALNGDTYSEGKRPFVHASYQVNPYISAYGFFTHEIGARTINQQQQGFNCGMTFDLKAMVNKEKAIF